MSKPIDNRKNSDSAKPRLLSRKDFFKESFLNTASLLSEIFSDTINAFETAFPDFIRPPGAVEEGKFLDLCTRCGKCIQACRFYAIKKVVKPASFDDGTPHLILKDAFCRMCEDFPCAESCPTGALLKPASNTQVVIGTAKVTRKHCIRKTGTICIACETACPMRFKAIFFDESKSGPSVDTARCRGCGACEAACPTEPEKAIFVISISR